MARFGLVFVFCLLPLCAQFQGVRKEGQTKNGPKRSAPVAPAKPAVSDDIVAVFRAVKASPGAGPKTEFESTAQYQARMASWKGGSRNYVFVLEKTRMALTDNYTLEYDADAQDMHLTVGEEYLVSDTLQIRSVRTVLGTSVGTNAFGVKKTIAEMLEHSYYLTLVSTSPFELFSKNSYGTLQPAKFSWAMSPADARAMKGWLRIAVVGFIPTPEATEEKNLTQPTISNPREILVYSHTLPFSLDELRVIDSRSGRTIHSWTKVDTPGPDGIVASPNGDFSFRSLKIFSGCAQSINDPSEVAGVLLNRTGRTWTNLTFSLIASGFDELSPDSHIRVVLERVVPGENPFDIAVGPHCTDAHAVRGGVIRVEDERQQPTPQPDGEGGGSGAPVTPNTAGPGIGSDVSTPPVVLFKKEPEYSEEARKAKYQGTVLLKLEVSADGRAANIRVVRSLGLGLDEKAIEAVKQWRFKPAYKNGRPVAAPMTLEVSFKLLMRPDS